MRRYLTAAIIVAMFVGTAAFSHALEFNVSNPFAGSYPGALYGSTNWAKLLSEKSGGHLKPKVFTGGVLLGGRESLAGIRDGVAQVGYVPGAYVPAELPESNLLQELGFNYNDNLVILGALSELNFTDPVMQSQWKRVGVVYGGAFATPPYVIFCREPIRNLEEIKGKKIRTPGNATSRWVESVGGVPVNVPSSEMYTGLEKGILDCAANAPDDLKSRSIWDVAKHVTMINVGIAYAGPNWAYNVDFWRSLSPKDRRIFFDVSAQIMGETYIGFETAGQEALKEAPEHGVSIYQPEADLQASRDAFVKMNLPAVASMAEKKYRIKDAAALIARFEEKVRKWEKLFAGVDRTDSKALHAVFKRELFDKIDVNTYGVK